MTFAYVFDAGQFRVRKNESVIIGLGTSVEVVSERTDSKLVGFASFFVGCWSTINARGWSA